MKQRHKVLQVRSKKILPFGAFLLHVAFSSVLGSLLYLFFKPPWGLLVVFFVVFVSLPLGYYLYMYRWFIRVSCVLFLCWSGYILSWYISAKTTLILSGVLLVLALACVYYGNLAVSEIKSNTPKRGAYRTTEDQSQPWYFFEMYMGSLSGILWKAFLDGLRYLLSLLESLMRSLGDRINP